MAAMRRFAFAALLANAVAQCPPEMGQTDIVQRDCDVAKEASDAVDKYCGDGFQGKLMDMKKGKEILNRRANNHNAILDGLKAAKNSNDTWTQVMSQVQEYWWVNTLAPWAVAVVGILIWLFCCWTCWPCCRCCRCCARNFKTQNGAVTKGFVVGVLLLLCGGIIAAAIISNEGNKNVRDGASNGMCSVSTLLNTTLAGSQESKFIGILPAVATFTEINNQLNDGSVLLTELDTIMAATQKIEDALLVATGVMDLMSDMLGLPSNNMPMGLTGHDLMHQCQFCQEIAPSVQQASDALNSGIASALQKARQEVSNQLTQQKREDLQQTNRNGVNPLLDLKKTFVEGVAKNFLEIDAPSKILTQLKTQGGPAVNIILLWSLLVTCCACCSTGAWTFKEKYTRKTDSQTDQELRFLRFSHRCASCTWCCGWIAFVIFFLVAGAVSLPATIASGACLMLNDLSGSMVMDMHRAFDMNVTADSTKAMLDLVDKCINPPDLSVHSNMFDVITVTNATGVKVTLREATVDAIKAPIDAQFDHLDGLVGNSTSMSIANNPNIVSLRSLVANNPINSLFIADQQKMSQDSTLQNLALDADLAVGFGTSARCADSTVSGNLGALTGKTIPGEAAFVTKLQAFGTTIPNPDPCLRKVVCNAALPAPKPTACAAGNAYVDLKLELTGTTTRIFHCDIFQTASGLDCDPINMAKSGSSYVNDCLITGSNGTKTMMRKQKMCNMAEFVTYVQGFDSRLGTVFTRLDTATSDTMAGIMVDLRGLVDVRILGPIRYLVDMMGCSFLAEDYRALVNSLCFQTVTGLSDISSAYLVYSAMILTMTLLMYAVWRRSVDNVNVEDDEDKKAVAPKGAPIVGIGQPIAGVGIVEHGQNIPASEV